MMMETKKTKGHTFSLKEVMVRTIVITMYLFSQSVAADCSNETPSKTQAFCNLELEWWDHTNVSYGSNSWQTMNIATPDGPGPHPILFWAHPNGGCPNNLGEKELYGYLDKGYAVVSWGSLGELTKSNLPCQEDDAFACFDYVRDNADTWNMDPDKIIVHGFSRGSAVSWKLMHSAHEAIIGIYTFNALPDPVWGNAIKAKQELIDRVTVDSPPIYMVYGPAWGHSDSHRPDNVVPIKARYEDLGMADSFTLYQDMWTNFTTSPDGEDGWTGWTTKYGPAHYFSEFVDSLESGESYAMADNFDGDNTEYPWTEIGPWYVSESAYHMDDLAGFGSVSAGDSAWTDYTYTADMITTAIPTQYGGAGSLAFRATDTRNMYITTLKLDGSLILRSIVDGRITIIDSIVTNYSPLDWHTYKIVVKGNIIQISIDEDLIIYAANSDIPAGKIGVVSSNSAISVDTVAVSTYVVPSAKVPTGHVFIDTAADLRLRLNLVDGVVQLRNKKIWAGAGSQWAITSAGGGYFFIDSVGQGLRLQGRDTGELQLVSTTKTGPRAKWSIEDNGDGTWLIDRVYTLNTPNERLWVDDNDSYKVKTNRARTGNQYKWVITEELYQITN